VSQSARWNGSERCASAHSSRVAPPMNIGCTTGPRLNGPMCPFGGRRDEAGAKSRGLPKVSPVCVRIAFSLIGRRALADQRRAAPRGTDGSNPSPSSGESANHRFPSGAAHSIRVRNLARPRPARGYDARTSWPRISPALLAAVWMLIYHLPLSSWLICASVSIAEPLIGLARLPVNGTTTPASFPGSAGP
jgi:hypothetical protein